MPLTLPKLDDVTWNDLSEEARGLIPGFAPAWTNFNASDPGITILELLAHFSEILLYRADQITDTQVELFLRLLNGPAWRAHASLDEERRKTLLSLAQTHRAVTANDFEALSMRATDFTQPSMLPQHRVARAKCIVNRNLEADETSIKDDDAPGHMSVVIVAQHDPAPAPATLRRVRKALDEARLITTRVHVIGPHFVSIRLRLTLHVTSTTSEDWVSNAAVNQLADYFDPLRGGTDEKGWPFGRHLFVSELYLMLSKIPGIEYVVPTSDPNGGENDEIHLAPAERWRKHYNAVDELESVELKAYELPRLEIAPEDITVRRKQAAR